VTRVASSLRLPDTDIWLRDLLIASMPRCVAAGWDVTCLSGKTDPNLAMLSKDQIILSEKGDVEWIRRFLRGSRRGDGAA
jgi:hypothetical protein